MKRQLPFALVFIFGLFMVFQYYVPHESSEFAYEFLMDWIVIIGIFAMALGIWSLFRVAVDKVSSRKHDWGYSFITLAGLFSMIIFGFTARTGESFGWFFLFVISILTAIFCLMIAMMKRSTATQKKLGAIGVLVFGVAAFLIGYFDTAWGFHFYADEGQRMVSLESFMFRAYFDHIMMPIMATMFSLLAFFIASAAYRAFRARNLLASLLLIAALIVMLRFTPGLGDLSLYINKTSAWLMNVPNLAAQRAIVMGVGLGIVATAMKVILGIERGYMGKG